MSSNLTFAILFITLSFALTNKSILIIKKIKKLDNPEGTYLAWLDFNRLDMDDKKLSEFMLKKAKVALDDGKIFGPGGEGFEWINVACAKSILEECMNRIVNALNGR